MPDPIPARLLTGAMVPSLVGPVLPPRTLPTAAERRRADPSLSIVLPCRNEAANLRDLLPELAAMLQTLASRWEIVVVDDGSRDETVALLASDAVPRGTRMLSLSRNFGKEAAMTAGLEAAVGDVVVLMDADGQHAPDLLPQLMQGWRDGCDMVVAVRANRDDESWLKRMGSRMVYGMLDVPGRFEITRDAGDFRLMDRAVVRALLSLPERNRFMKGLYAWVGFRTMAVPYVPRPRAHGRTHFPALRLASMSVDALTAFTTWPLRAVGLLGFGIAILAFLYGAFLTVDYMMEGHRVNGWTTIVVSLMLMGGLQMISLGVVGAYVGRIVEEVKRRPVYLVGAAHGEALAGRGDPAAPAPAGAVADASAGAVPQAPATSAVATPACGTAPRG